MDDTITDVSAIAFSGDTITRTFGVGKSCLSWAVARRFRIYNYGVVYWRDSVNIMLIVTVFIKIKNKLSD